MRFKTDQAREAYAEMVGQAGRSAQQVRADLEELAKAHPSEAIMLQLTGSLESAKIHLDGLQRAISVASEVDARWVTVAGSLTLAGEGR